MENKYNELEKRFLEENLSDKDKLKILEMQKELLLQFLIESNKSLFETLITRKKESDINNSMIQEII